MDKASRKIGYISCAVLFFASLMLVGWGSDPKTRQP